MSDLHRLPVLRCLRLATLVAAALLLAPAAARADQTLTFDADVPASGPDTFDVPFQVPAGIVEIEVDHTDGSNRNILDWGLEDPDGFRGWGGGNAEPAIVGVDRASRSYLPGPITPGTWKVVVGKAQILDPPGHYHLVVTLRTQATLAPQPERAPYTPVAALETGARWYQGDFHVHSRESGDASATLDDIATFARGRGLDFVEISDHNTVSQLDYFDAVQARHPHLLLVPGEEWTTYHGHANAIGVTRYVNHRLGVDGVTVDTAAADVRAQGGLFSINHPMLNLGRICIGCPWTLPTPTPLDGVEIENGGLKETAGIFTKDSLAFWDTLCAGGRHLAALGGSDDHHGGAGGGSFYSPIADPTTMVYAQALDVQSILDAVRAGHTVVKLQGPADPMIELTAGDAMVGDTVHADAVTLTVKVEGGQGDTLHLVRDGGLDGAVIPIDADPFVVTRRVSAPATGEDRWRAEVWESDNLPHTVTSHLWIAAAAGDAGAGAGGAGGCGCGAVPGAGRADAALVLLAAIALGLGVRRRRRPSIP